MESGSFRSKITFLGMLGTAAVLIALTVVLIALQNNVRYEKGDSKIEYLDVEKSETVVEEQEPSTLIIYEEGDTQSENGRKLMEDILSQMKIPYEVCSDAGKAEFDKYSRIVLGVTHIQLISDCITDLKNWVKEGGGLMFLYIPEYSGVFTSMFNMIGGKDSGGSISVVEGLHFNEELLIGSTLKDFRITDPFECSMTMSLEDDCRVYMQSDDEYPVPLIWTHEFGKGIVAVDNLGILEKSYRGFHCAVYSLLGDACLYPVINGSAFYIDDFPSPVPGGNGEYITRDYGMSVSEFYTQVWWPDVYNLAEKYGIRYTGMVIEQYSDDVKAPFKKNEETERYKYFGNMLLQEGGEIGIHGYNHMPLVLENFDYEGQYDSYKQWNSYDDMKEGLEEVISFVRSIYSDRTISTYVPPSNILSEEGRGLIANEFKEIKAIASVYIEGDLALAQEFDVGEDGIVNTPRIISGYNLNDFTDISALSELTFHYVNTHFQHPDDVLDEDRGAALGWTKLIGRLSEYVDWLYTAAPEIRNLTGAELGAEVQRYDYIDVVRHEDENGMKVHLNNFYDSAQFILRINNKGGEPSVSGGKITKIGEDLYLIEAEKEDLEICYR